MKKITIYCLLLFGILLVPNIVLAQNEPNDVVTIDDGFEDFFYEAIKQKSIENYDKAIQALKILNNTQLNFIKQRLETGGMK